MAPLAGHSPLAGSAMAGTGTGTYDIQSLKRCGGDQFMLPEQDAAPHAQGIFEPGSTSTANL